MVAETLYLLIEQKAKEIPNEVVFKQKIQSGWKSLTFNEYLFKSNQLAKALTELGIKKGDIVASFSNNCIEQNILDLALLKIGALHSIYFPNYGVENLSNIISRTKPKAIFTGKGVFLSIVKKTLEKFSDSSLLYCFSKNNGNVTSIYELTYSIKDNNDYKHHVKTIDYYSLYFTSGTTGNTKGVLVTNQAIVATVIKMKAIFKLSKDDKAISFAPLAVSSERCLNYFYQCAGITTYYPESMELLIQNIQEIKPSMFLTSPLMLNKIRDNVFQKMFEMPDGFKKILFKRALLFSESPKNLKPKNLLKILLHILYDKLIFKKLREILGGKVKFIVSGGAASSFKTIIFFHNIGVPVYEGYGMTECHIISLNKPEDYTTRFNSVGKPFGNVEIKLSVDGEILCKSPYTFSAYFDDLQSTNNAFTYDNFFKTGDKGVITKEGNLKIVGRIKTIFKTQAGIYINPEGIEAQLNQSDTIEQSIVVGENQAFIAALVYPNLKIRKLSNDEQYIHIQKTIEQYNLGKIETEQIHKIYIIENPFTIDKNELTLSGKLIRDSIINNYNSVINQLYENK